MSDHSRKFVKIETDDNQKNQDSESREGKEKHSSQTITFDAFAKMGDISRCRVEMNTLSIK